MKVQSLWLADEKDEKIQTLNQSINVDVLIIGGGITGISTLYHLKNSDLKICLVEQNIIGHGVTGRTTGKINYLQGTVYRDLVNKYSLEVAEAYLLSQLDAIKQIKRIIKKENIDCNFEKVDSYVFSSKLKDINKLLEEKAILEKLGIKVIDSQTKKGYAIGVTDTYVFHPLKYLRALKKICIEAGKEIFEKTKIYKIKKDQQLYICYTKDYVIRAKKIIFACHYPFFILPYLMPLKTYTEKSIITASLANYKTKTLLSSSNPCQSIRYYQDDHSYMIYLSNSHNICNSLNENKNYKQTIIEANNLGLKPLYIWKNDDLITVDKMPYIGKIQKHNEQLLIGTGYNTWGMTNGTLAGMILSDIILGRKNEYEKLFNPLRTSCLSDIDKYMINVGSSMKGFIQNKLFKNKSWYDEKVKVVKHNGKSIGIYDDGEKHMVYNKCPHMGCSLIFNEVEKTWDCPCHASRFDIDGKCIKGPSVYDISYKDEF